MFALIGNLYFTFLYQPLYNLVLVLYNLSPEPKLAWAMIILSLLVRFIFLYFTLKGFKTDELLKEVTPSVREIESDHRLSEREKRGQITQLLKSKGINPLSEIYTVLGQLLFIAVLYQIVQSGLSSFEHLYSFVPVPNTPLDTYFFGQNIAHPSFILSLVAAGLLCIEQIWEYEDKKDIAESSFSGQWYPLLLPITTFILLMLLPATKAVFLATSVIFSLGIRFMVTAARRSRN